MLLISFLLMACGDAEKPTDIETKANTKEVVKKDTPSANSKGADKTDPKADAATASAGAGCDAQLKEYSDFVDEYIALMEKASKGDASAIQRYPALLKKAESSGKDLEALQKDGKIDAECWKKYNAINNRMTEAAMNMSGASAEDKKDLEELQKANEKAVDQAACMQKCQKKSDPMAATTCMQGCM